MTAVPVWAWAATLAVLAVLIVVDLALTRGPENGLRAAAVESALWVAAALAFGAVLWLWRGPAIGSQYLAGYLLERALSVDNVFVFVLLFASMRVPAELQRRILFLGVVGALVLRGVFIAAGGALIESVSWIFYVFGAMVLLAGARMFRAGEGGSGNNLAVRGLRRVLPVTEQYDGRRLITRAGGRALATPLLVALVAIAVTDVVFALDSIPAVFGVTSDLFVVFTSNAFAVLGLRALYFLLAGSADRFVYLKPGIALLLVFIGVKMLLYDVVHIPIWASLVVIAVVAGGAMGASVWRDRRLRGRPGPGRQGDHAEHEVPPDRRPTAERRPRSRAGRGAARTGAYVSALASLQVDSLLSYAIAIVLPALDAILPVLPSETAVITLGVATAGSTDPRIALLVACCAAGAFLGDNLCYLLGRRFAPWIERRFFRSEKGAKRRAWAERSLERYGMPLIVVCRFIPGGRTAVMLSCGIIRYDRRRFIIATAIAGVIWASYSFFIGRLGGKAFEDKPWAGLLLAFGGTLAVSGLIELVRRIRARRTQRQADSDTHGHADTQECGTPTPDDAPKSPVR